MASDISIKFGVEGEGSFKTALSACEASIKSLNAEFKKVVSGGEEMEAQEKVLSQTSDALKSKISVLTSEYDKQKSKLSDLAKEVEKAKSAEGDNADAILKAENAYNKQIKVVADLSTKLSKAETDLNNTTKSMEDLKNGTNEASDAMDSAGGGVGSLTSKLGDFKTIMTTAVVAAAAAGAAAIVALGKSALSAYADFEQLEGGVETLFGDSSGTVMANAQNAFKTVGLSANEYMENVTSFSASLISSLSGNTQKAAEVADRAMVDMADNANKMGTDMASIQNAYQGFAKQNYTMLDNLKLGYGGTKAEMERLLKDAKEFSGIDYDISSYSDIIEAIHVIQTEMGITGTTAKEAEATITGSLSMTKAAFENFATALGTGDGVNEALQNVADSVKSVLSNVIPVIETIIAGIADTLPQFLEMGVELVVAFIEGLTEKMPDLIPQAAELITTLTTSILQHLPELITVAWQLIIALGTGIINAAPTLIENAGQVMSQLVTTIKESIQALIDGALNWGRDMIDAFVNGIKSRIAAVKSAVTSVAKTVKNIIGFSEPKEGPLSNFHTFAPDMMELFAKGIYNNIDLVRNASSEAANGIGLDFQTAKLLMGANNSSNNGQMHLTIQIGNQTIYDAYNSEVIRKGNNMVTV